MKPRHRRLRTTASYSCSESRRHRLRHYDRLARYGVHRRDEANSVDERSLPAELIVLTEFVFAVVIRRILQLFFVPL